MSTRLRPERLPGETDAAYEMIRRYCALGAGRSLEKLRQDAGKKSVRHLERWSRRYSWAARARLVDAAVAEADAAAKLRALEADAEKWADRVRRQRETDWGLALALRSRAAEILQRSLDDPSVRWTFRDAAAFAKLAADLGRLACELPTENFALSGPSGGPIVIQAMPTSMDQVAEILMVLDQAGALKALGDPTPNRPDL